MNMIPMWGYPPPQNNRGQNPRDIERAVQKAVRQAMQYRDHDKKDKRRRREEASKKSAAKRAKMFTYLELFILGVVLQPFVVLISHIIYNHFETIAH